MALALRLGITPDQMKEMTLPTLYNTMIACTNQETERTATQADIDRLFS